MRKLHEFFSIIEDIFDKFLVKNNSVEIRHTIIKESENFMKNLSIGKIIPLKCGHNGNFSREELDLYRLILIANKIID